MNRFLLSVGSTNSFVQSQPGMLTLSQSTVCFSFLSVVMPFCNVIMFDIILNIANNSNNEVHMCLSNPCENLRIQSDLHAPSQTVLSMWVVSMTPTCYRVFDPSPPVIQISSVPLPSHRHETLLTSCSISHHHHQGCRSLLHIQSTWFLCLFQWCSISFFCRFIWGHYDLWTSTTETKSPSDKRWKGGLEISFKISESRWIVPDVMKFPIVSPNISFTGTKT